MTILRKIINDKKREQKKYRNKDLTLAMVLGATAGVLTGIAVNSKSDKINKTFKKIKNKTTESMENGKDKLEDLLEERMVDLKNIKTDLKKEFKDGKDKAEDAKKVLDDKIDKSKDEIRDKAEDTKKVLEDKMDKGKSDLKDKAEEATKKVEEGTKKVEEGTKKVEKELKKY